VPETAVIPAPIEYIYVVAANDDGDSRAQSKRPPRELGVSMVFGSWVLAWSSGAGC
jgi:hypothetical protein